MSVSSVCRLVLRSGARLSGVRVGVWGRVGVAGVGVRQLSHVPVDDVVSGLTQEQIQVCICRYACM